MIPSIRSRNTFAELRTVGKQVRSGAVRMRYLRLPDGSEPQIGFALSRRFGNAVERNRSRRRLRAAFNQAWYQPDRVRPQPGAFLLTGTRSLLTDDYQRLIRDVDRCLVKLAEPDSERR